MKKALGAVGILFGLYLIVRALLEPFVIDMTDPATYQQDWGGPSLAGVLLVHCGPGVAAAVLIGLALRRWRRRRARRSAVTG
ncbi:hypothetical protein I0C86_39890 [Plantactinospora sp. S1510]|uniref:Uncharacterized protein n=1 Tax=Plantactinospora alkalitolerans TaxID=2789879 RepID=A0ABS0H992_9ACTN|nr:hypothetical protein [Plantactinospora alkalitolerans]MBF9135041.1 hypothetical protein [Plantactinospora alkalitolerans]